MKSGTIECFEKYINFKELFGKHLNIEKFQDNVDWERISEYQKLSESFMENLKTESIGNWSRFN